MKTHLVLLVTVASITTIRSATFEGLGDLAGGLVVSRAEDVSADGRVVVGESYSGRSSPNSEIYRWSPETGMIGLGDLPGGGFQSFLSAVSGNGRVVVGLGTTTSAGGATQFATAWRDLFPPVSLGQFEMNGSGSATAASFDGSIVVGYASRLVGGSIKFIAFRWDATNGMRGLSGAGAPDFDLPGGDTISSANDVSADGSVIVGQGRSFAGPEAFRWTESLGFQPLGDLTGGSYSSSASSVSVDGSIIVGSSDALSGTQAFRWTLGEGMVALSGPPGGPWTTVAESVSANGKTIVGYARSQLDTDIYVAVVWDAANGFRPIADILRTNYRLPLTGWDLVQANGVSSDGTVIVGTGINAAGQREAFRIAGFGLPELVLKGKNRVSTKSEKITLKGSAFDDIGISRVEYRVGNRGRFEKVRGSSRWRIAVPLASGVTKISVRAVDTDRQRTDATRITVRKR